MEDDEDPRFDYVASDLEKADEIMRGVGLSEEDRARILFRHLRAGNAGLGGCSEHEERLRHEIMKKYHVWWKIDHSSPIEDERWGRGKYSKDENAQS